MRIVKGAAILVALNVAGCGGPDGDNGGSTSPAGSQSAGQQRGGTITVGEESWTIVPSISCSIYPGNIVNIAGHAAENTELEIVIDWGGPNQVRIAEHDSAPGWYAVEETLDVQVDGKTVKGSATFGEHFGGGGEQADGSFEVTC
ncbi:MAG TPA: hypothetical protein VF389_09105 [Woeseiaceae bacterium]